jgi:prepilin-type processing-associated H-X9-DG protein
MITHYVIFSLLPHIATWVHFMNCSGKLLNIIIPIVDEISITWTNVIEISSWYHLIPMQISVLAIGQVVLATLPRDSQQMLAMAPWPQRVVMVVLYVKQWCQLSAQANFGFVDWHVAWFVLPAKYWFNCLWVDTNQKKLWCHFYKQCILWRLHNAYIDLDSHGACYNFPPVPWVILMIGSSNSWAVTVQLLVPKTEKPS